MSRAEREGWRDESSLASCSNRASRVFVSLSFGGVKKRCGDRRERERPYPQKRYKVTLRLLLLLIFHPQKNDSRAASTLVQMFFFLRPFPVVYANSAAAQQ